MLAGARIASHRGVHIVHVVLTLVDPGESLLMVLGPDPHDPVETIKATVDPLMIWELIQPRKGVDNYSWKGNKIEGLSGNVTWTANLTSPTALAKM